MKAFAVPEWVSYNRQAASPASCSAWVLAFGAFAVCAVRGETPATRAVGMIRLRMGSVLGVLDRIGPATPPKCPHRHSGGRVPGSTICKKAKDVPLAD